MAEVGVVPFAHLAREVAATVLPPYRTRFSGMSADIVSFANRQ